jgi:hypothetical protein
MSPLVMARRNTGTSLYKSESNTVAALKKDVPRSRQAVGTQKGGRIKT